MGTTRKFVLPVTILILMVIPFMVKTYAKKPLAIFNGEKVSVIDNGFEFDIKANGNTVIEILKNSGITVKEQDIVFPTGTLKKNQKIIILRSVPVTLNIKGDKKKIYTSKGNVGEVLKEAEVNFPGSDILNYDLSEKIYPGMQIILSAKPKPKSAPEPILTQNTKVKKVLTQTSNSKPKPVSKIQKTGETQSGSASWYSYIPGNYCASLRFARGTRLLVTNIANGRSVIATVNDTGPFNGRVIDLERSAFSKIAPLGAGTASVRVQKIK